MPRTPPRTEFAEMRQQVPLREHPCDMMEMACKKCGRRGRVSKARLIAQWGGDIGLVDLLQVIAKDCPKQTPDWQGIRRRGSETGSP